MMEQEFTKAEQVWIESRAAFGHLQDAWICKAKDSNGIEHECVAVCRCSPKMGYEVIIRRRDNFDEVSASYAYDCDRIKMI